MSFNISISAKKSIDEMLSNNRRNVLDVIDKLNNNLWKGGTRVKKLHGVSQKNCIYEARIDKANRLLFTVNSESGLVIHEAFVKHDDVIRVAQTILKDNINIEEYEEEENLTVKDIEEYQRENNIDQIRIYSYIEHNKYKSISEEDFIRWFENVENNVDKLIEFKLNLSKEQEKVVNAPSPLLIDGCAGSGKTTVLLYRLVASPEKRKLYVTLSDELCKETENQFKKLIRGMDEEEILRDNTDFVSFQNLLSKLSDYRIEETMNKEMFMKRFRIYSKGNQKLSKFQPEVAWEEIRSIIRCYENRDLSLEEYLALKLEEAPNFYDIREEFWKVYMWYKDNLSKECTIDQVDIIRKYINKLEDYQYDIVVCDEVQDLSMLEISLIFKIVKNNKKDIIFAGDTHQVVNHSGFTWEKLKQLFYKNFNQTIPEFYKLYFNYRSTGNIVKLANEVNKIQKEILKGEYRECEINREVLGNPPAIFNSSNLSKSVLEKFQKLGPTQGIIVRDKDAAIKLRNFYKETFSETPIIFSIAESKGLEFESIVLLGLCSDENTEWEKIRRRVEGSIELKNTERDFIKSRVGQLYVAVTRAMKECLICEFEDESSFWNYDNIKGALIKCQKIEDTITLPKVKVDEGEWFTQGVKYFENKSYTQAIDCLERIKSKSMSSEAKELIYECKKEIKLLNGEFEEVLKDYIKKGDLESAGKLYDQLGMYKEGADLLRNNRKFYDLYVKLEAKYMDSIGEYSKSKILYGRMKEYRKAYDRSKKTNDYSYMKWLVSNGYVNEDEIA